MTQRNARRLLRAGSFVGVMLLWLATAHAFAVTSVQAPSQALRPYGALIAWETDPYTTGHVEYGLTAAYGSVSYTDLRARTHVVDLRGLAPATPYHFRIRSTGDDGQTAMSQDQTFTTPPERATTVAVAGGYLATPMTLNSANTRYVLQSDVVAETGAFVIGANDITLDLNGHTVTYDAYQTFPQPLGLPNPGFEAGAGAIPAIWDLSRAPHARRQPTSLRAFGGSWYLEIDEPPNNGEEFISGWSWLPANTRSAAILNEGFVPSEWICISPQPPCYNPVLNLSIERRDGVLVYTFASNTSYPLENIFTTGGSDDQYRVHFIVQEWRGRGNSYQRNLSFDEFHVLPYANRGIVIAGLPFSNVLIRNGRLLQGRGNSTRGHAIYASGATNVAIDGVWVEVAGIEAEGITQGYSTAGSILNSRVTSQAPFKFSRHQLSAPLSYSQAQGVIFNNTVSGGRSWGGILLSHNEQNGNTLIAYNNVTTQSVVVNHHAIVLWHANGTRIFNNVLTGNPGQGILTQGPDVSVYDNNISLLFQRPDLISGVYSRDAIRFNNYWGDTCDRNWIDGNQITLVGDFEDYYLPGYPLTNYELTVNGVTWVCGGRRNIVSNNTIRGTLVDARGVYVNNLEPGSSSPGVLYINNTLESNGANIMYGDYPRLALNSTFISNTLIRGPNPINYHTLDSFQGVGGAAVTNNRFIDTTLLNGATFTPSTLDFGAVSSPYNYTVEWLLDVAVQSALGAPLPGATVTVRAANGAVVASGFTNALGRLDNILLVQARYTGAAWQITPAAEVQTPHTLSVTLSGYAPATQSVTMDASKTVTITLGTLGSGVLLYSPVDNAGSVDAPPIAAQRLNVSGVQTTGSGQVTFGAGRFGQAATINGFAPNQEWVVFHRNNFDLMDLAGDGGRLDYWIRFNQNPQVTTNYFIARTSSVPAGPPWWHFTMELVASGYPFFEFYRDGGQPQSSGGRLVVAPNGWSRWTNMQAGEWHQVTLTWRRNYADHKAELHLYLDGDSDGCAGCHDYNGNLLLPEDWEQLEFGSHTSGTALDFTLDEVWSFDRWNFQAQPGSTYASLQLREGVTLTYPDSGAALNTTSVILDFLARSNTSASFACDLFLNGALRQALPAVPNDTLTPVALELAAGTYAWDVRCENGRLASASRTFTVAAGSAPACSPDGQSRSCTTAQNCPGTQTCSGGAWTTCADVPADGCPADSGTYIFQNGLNGYTGTTEAGIAGPAIGLNSTRLFGAIRRIGSWTTKNVLRFDLSPLPDGAAIQSASLYLYEANQWGTPTNVTLYRLLRTWTKPGVTWACTNDAGQDGCMAPEMAWQTLGAEGGTDRDMASADTRPITPLAWNAWDVTGHMRAWVEGGQPNAGFLLEERDGRGATFSGPAAATQALRPRLEVRLVQSGSCALPENQPPCECITGAELFQIVQAWFEGRLTLRDLLTTLRAWRANPNC